MKITLENDNANQNNNNDDGDVDDELLDLSYQLLNLNYFIRCQLLVNVCKKELISKQIVSMGFVIAE